MSAALESLRPLCPEQATENPSNIGVDKWTEALNAQFFGKGQKIAGQEWEQLLGQCEASVAKASPSLATELRDYSRCRAFTGKSKPQSDVTVTKLGRNKSFVVASCLDARFLSRLRPFFKLVWMTFFSDVPSADIAKKRFEFTDTQIVAGKQLQGSPETLLEYKAGEGWERFCILLKSDDAAEDEYPSTMLGDVRAFGEKMNKITYGVFQGLGGTVVMQVAVVGSVGISMFSPTGICD